MSRSKLPAELREALRAAERLDGRRGGRPRRAVMAGLAAVLCVAGAAVWYAVEGGGVPGLPRVVYGIPEGKPELDGRALVLPRVTYGTPAGTAEPDGRARFTARVSVVDGDTLATGGDRLRIFGIDAPEMAQSCERGGAAYACGARAREAMGAILGRGVVSCEQRDTDRYGRRVVRCHNAAGADIGAELVRQGWAVAFRQYSRDYVAQEAEARAARRGLWQGRFEDPGAWRAGQR